MEKNYNELVRLRRHWADLSELAVPTEKCYEAGRIFDAARGDASPAECREIVDHVVDCPVCAETWRLAYSIDYHGEAVAAHPSAWRSASNWMMAVAAMLLLLVAGGNMYISYIYMPDPHYRDLQESSAAIEPAQDIVASRDGFTLRWQVVPESAGEAMTFRVEVKTREDLQDIVEEWDVPDNQYHVEARLLQGLPSGTVLLWQVQASFDGRAVLRSPPQQLVLQ
ncbi:MAG TPA: hypothetical protein VLU25_21005 [Acidobacteriota bacterium]|nr:hypothetical protein [Acidobacteriota bacterium]